MKKILITGFKPFGLGKLINRNESEVVALKLKEKYNFETLILPVKDLCVQKLVSKIKTYKPNIIICFGQGPELRIETQCYNKKNRLNSKFAKILKNELGFVNEEIGDYYCNDVYYAALSRVPKTVFIHVPLFESFNEVDKIVKEIMK